MHRHWRAVVSALLSLVAVLVVTGATTGTANAAPARASAPAPGTTVSPDDNWWVCAPGSNLNCDNTDPFATGCANTKEYVQSNDAWRNGTHWQIQLWYSTGCQTIWARLQLLAGTNSCPACTLSVYRNNYNSSTHASTSVGSPTGTIYSGAWTDQLRLWCTTDDLKGYVLIDDYYQGAFGQTYGWSNC